MRAIDPADRNFNDTTLLPAGDYVGRSICEVAATSSGLLYLDKISRVCSAAPWATPRIRRAIGRLLAQPARQRALDHLYEVK